MIQYTISNFFDVLYKDNVKSLVTIDEIRDAFHSNQMQSKNQAIAAYDSVHTDGSKVLFIGSWYGLMTNYLLEKYDCYVAEIDIDMRCQTISTALNSHSSRYLGHYTADINVFDRMDQYDLIINLSTEHMTTDWFYRVLPGTRLVLQNNNLQINDHINNCTDLQDMKRKYPLSSFSYENTLELNVYNRFTLAGIK